MRSRFCRDDLIIDLTKAIAPNTIEKEILSALSPYITKHINRFGSYSLDLNQKPPALDFEFSLNPI